MTCPFCSFSDPDLFVVERHAVESHPEWAEKLVSKSALRRVISLSEKE